MTSKEIIRRLIAHKAGMSVFLFDQPDAYPSKVLAKEMCELFRSVGGGWIAKDYPTYHDIGVELAWAGWARDVITANSAI